MHHGVVEAYTCWGADASLLVQQLDSYLASADSLRTAVRVRLAAILSADELLNNLGTFEFVALHLFSVRGSHLSAIADILRLVNSLEELHTEVQGVISSPHLAMTLLCCVSRPWSLYLNRCVALMGIIAG